MDYVLILFATVIVFALGYFIGVAQNGVNITINHHDKSKELPVNEDNEPVYNQSYEDFTDQEARTYLEQNRGTIKI